MRNMAEATEAARQVHNCVYCGRVPSLRRCNEARLFEATIFDLCLITGRARPEIIEHLLGERFAMRPLEHADSCLHAEMPIAMVCYLELSQAFQDRLRARAIRVEALGPDVDCAVTLMKWVGSALCVRLSISRKDYRCLVKQVLMDRHRAGGLRLVAKCCVLSCGPSQCRRVIPDEERVGDRVEHVLASPFRSESCIQAVHERPRLMHVWLDCDIAWESYEVIASLLIVVRNMHRFLIAVEPVRVMVIEKDARDQRRGLGCTIVACMHDNLVAHTQMHITLVGTHRSGILNPLNMHGHTELSEVEE